MKLIRACSLVLAVLLPVSWTIAHAEGDDPKEGSKKKGKGKKAKRKEGGDMGDMKGDMDKK